MSKIEVDAIDKQSGSTLTLGGSGTAVTLAAGATQSGFGRTGTVDWQTGSIKTSTFTATSGEGYFCNTGGGAFTVNLPAGSAGAIVSLQDYNNTFDSNNLTVTPNGSEKINGGAGSIALTTEGEGITLVYIDGTVGWRSIQDNDFSNVGSNFISATGGTITTDGNFKIHTFTGPGTFAISATGTPSTNSMDYVVVGGGGSGGTSASPRAGGGAAGGYRESPGTATCYTASPLGASPAVALTSSIASFPITVGGGGAGVTGPNNRGNQGNTSTFSTISSAGGGYGGSGSRPFGCGALDAGPGGSGGGSGSSDNGTPDPTNGGTIGSGNTPPVSPPQGNNGGQGVHAPGNWAAGGGGGGAGAVGGNASPKATPGPGASGGNGGNGVASEITGSSVTRAGGGGSTGVAIPQTSNPGGTGGGGTGNSGSAGGAGTANTGGGGGAGSDPAGSGTGGSGIVIIRYKFQ